MNPNFWGRVLIGLVCGAILVGVLKWRLHENRSEVPADVGIIRCGFELPPLPKSELDTSISRADAALEIARLEAKVKDLEAKLAIDPRKQRGVRLAKSLAAAAKAGWDSEETKNADAALADFLAGLARDAGVDDFEFALNPERDALIAAFLEGLGMPLDGSHELLLSDLLELERKRWPERLEERKAQTTIERLASAFGDAAAFESRLAAILTPDQQAALSHRFELRSHGRSIPPWRDHNLALGPREAPQRQLYGRSEGDSCSNLWWGPILGKDRAPKFEVVKSYADWYEREMLGMEKLDDMLGGKSIPPAWRAKQAKLQAEAQKRMLEDDRFSDQEKERIREWRWLFDPAR